MKSTVKSIVYVLLTFLFIFSLGSNSLFAQKIFEGYWEDETVTTSDLPFQKDKKIERDKIFFKRGKMRVDNLTTNETTIIRFDKGLTWTLNHNDKTYSEITFDQLKQSMKSAQKAFAETMKNMDPQQKEMMKKMMGEKLGTMFDEGELPTLSIIKTGKKKTIKGYSCYQVILKLGDKPFMELWMTDKYNLGDDILKIYQNMGFIKGKVANGANLRGFPIYSKINMDSGMGTMVEETTVVKIVPTKVSDSKFEPPKGYRKNLNEMPF